MAGPIAPAMISRKVEDPDSRQRRLLPYFRRDKPPPTVALQRFPIRASHVRSFLF